MLDKQHATHAFTPRQIETQRACYKSCYNEYRKQYVFVLFVLRMLPHTFLPVVLCHKMEMGFCLHQAHIHTFVTFALMYERASAHEPNVADCVEP